MVCDKIRTVIEVVTFSPEFKITYDLLAPSLQARFVKLQSDITNLKAIVTDNTKQAKINIANSKQNADDIAALKKYIDDMIANIISKLNPYLYLPDGTGEGMNYAYRTGLYGQLIKVDKPFQRAFPHEDFIGLAYLIPKGVSASSVASECANSITGVYNLVYDVNTGTLYTYNGGWNVVSSINSNADESNQTYSVRIIFSRTFIFDNHTKYFYFFYSPQKYIRLL